MGAAALSQYIKDKCLFHLGYLGTLLGPSINLGIPAANQPMFIISWAEENLSDTSGFWPAMVNDILAKLDATRQQIFDAQTRLAASKAGSVEMNINEIDRLKEQYLYWGGELCNVFGSPRNPYAYNFPALGGTTINIPVMNA